MKSGRESQTPASSRVSEGGRDGRRHTFDVRAVLLAAVDGCRRPVSIHESVNGESPVKQPEGLPVRWLKGRRVLFHG